jgi:muconate cycloisomerase
MKIAELTAFHVRIPLKRPIRHASHTRTETDNVIVRCVLADKSEGYGEGLPRVYVTGETIDSALELLKRSDLPAQFDNCRDFAAVLRWAEGLRLAPVPGDDRQRQGNAARCAVELAVLDAYGRAFGEPLMNVTKMLAPELYEPREHVQYSGAIASARGWKLRLVAGVMRCYGFHQVKLKVGIPGYNDAKRARSLRLIAGRKMDLRVDANEAWSPDESVEKIRALEPAGITSVEQPVAHEKLNSLPSIRKQVGTPIMLDESLCSQIDAEHAVTLQACDMFNLRLSKCGGFIPTLRLAQFAQRNGLGYQLGCQVGETAILSAAGRHFATSVKGIHYLEGSYDRHLVHAALGMEDLTFRRGGWANALVSCGLSFTVDPAALGQVTVRKESLFG